MLEAGAAHRLILQVECLPFVTTDESVVAGQRAEAGGVREGEASSALGRGALRIVRCSAGGARTSGGGAAPLAVSLLLVAVGVLHEALLGILKVYWPLLLRPELPLGVSETQLVRLGLGVMQKIIRMHSPGLPLREEADPFLVGGHVPRRGVTCLADKSWVGWPDALAEGLLRGTGVGHVPNRAAIVSLSASRSDLLPLKKEYGPLLVDEDATLRVGDDVRWTYPLDLQELLVDWYLESLCPWVCHSCNGCHSESSISFSSSFWAPTHLKWIGN